MKKIQPIYALLITLVLLYAFSNNPPNGHTGAPGNDNCTSCHTPNNSGFDGSVKIAGIPEEITPNTTYNLSIVTKITAGNPTRSGFQMLILDDDNNNAGTLENGDASSAVASEEGRDYLENKGAKSFNGVDSVEWVFQWTAPATLSNDSIKFYINNLIGNGSGSAGDLMVSSRPVVPFVLPPAEPVVATIAESKDVSCFGSADGTATVSVSGGRGDFTFEWSNGATTATIADLEIGRYIVTATDAEGSEAIATIDINEPLELTIAIDNQTDINCNITIGNATAAADGGTSPYTYTWSNDASGATVDLTSGTHTVTVTDANNCTMTTTVDISSDMREPIAFAGFDVTVTCTDTNTASVQLDAFNTTIGTGVEYSWTTENGSIVSGETTLMPVVDATGSYVLTVTNSVNGCIARDTAEVVFDVDIPVANIGAAQQLGCQNTSVTLDGSASSQGDNLAYNWTTEDGNIMSGASTLMPIVTSGGTYTLTVSNTMTGCSNTSSVIVTEDNNMPTADAGMAQQIDCNNSTAVLNGTASEGEGITFAWTTEDGNFVSGGTTLTPTVNRGGTYILTVNNSNNNCTSMSSVMVIEDVRKPSINAGTATLDCNSPTLTLNGTGDVDTSIVYRWTTTNGTIVSGETTLTPTIEGGGIYILSATNPATGCRSFSQLVLIQNMDMPAANAGENKKLDCSTSSVTLNGSGSTGNNITYLWTTEEGNIMMDESTLTPTVTDAGIYTLTVTNTANGCTSTASVEVTQDATFPMVEVGMNQTLDCDSDTLAIIAAGSTGSNISYLWTTEDGMIVGDATNLAVTIVGTGTYNLMVSDNINSCSSSSSVTIMDSNLAIADAGNGATIGCNVSTVMLDGSASQGEDLSYVWTTQDGNIESGSETATPTVNSAGTYTLMVTNIDGCSSTASVVVTGVSQADFFAASGDSEQLTCNKMSVTLNANATQGENVINEWTTEGGNIVSGGNTLMPTIDAAGNYILTVRDTVTGCMAVSSINIAEDINPPNVSAGDTQTLNCGTTSLILNGSSTNQFNIAYNWTTQDGNILNGANTPTPEVNAAGTYTLTVVDTMTNCNASATIQVGQEESVPTANAGMAMGLDCRNDTLVLAGSGSTGEIYTVQWATENGNILGGATTFTPMINAAGDYLLTVTDTLAGCSSTSRVIIVADFEKPMVEAGAAEQIFCKGDTLALTGMASEGDNFTYFWCTEMGSIVSGAEDLNVLIEGGGLFEFIVTNTTNGCKNADTVLVTEASNPEIVLGVSEDSTIALNVEGGAIPYIYSFNNVDSISLDSIGYIPGDYELTVTDANGCSDFLEFTVETSTSVNELAEVIESLEVFPNPTADYFNLKIDFANTQIGTVFILNNIGQKVWTQSFDEKLLNYQIEANDWANGQYFMVIQTNQGLRTESIMVIR